MEYSTCKNATTNISFIRWIQPTNYQLHAKNKAFMLNSWDSAMTNHHKVIAQIKQSRFFPLYKAKSLGIWSQIFWNPWPIKQRQNVLTHGIWICLPPESKYPIIAINFHFLIDIRNDQKSLRTTGTMHTIQLILHIIITPFFHTLH